MAPDLADWYDTPHYYDIIFDQDTDKEAVFLSEMMRLHSVSAKTAEGARKKAQPEASPWNILEPACGSGRLVSALVRDGHRVAGFDLNEEMLAYAQRRLDAEGQKARLWKDRMEDFTVPKGASPKGGFDLAHCLVSTFKYVMEEAGAVSHLQSVAAQLRAGGLYVLGLHLTDYADQKEQHERWHGQRDGVKVTCNTHTWPADKKARTEDLRTRLTITQDGKKRVQETRWQFRTYDARQLKKLLAAAPELECVACYDFTYNLEQTRKLDDAYSDIVLVLRKAGEGN